MELTETLELKRITVRVTLITKDVETHSHVSDHKDAVVAALKTGALRAAQAVLLEVG